MAGFMPNIAINHCVLVILDSRPPLTRLRNDGESFFTVRQSGPFLQL
jgi:hypothetical protein